MKEPARSHMRRARPGPAGRRRPLLLLIGLAALAAVLALSVPAIGESASPAPPAEIGHEALVSEGRPFLTLPWGAGPGEVGLTRPEDGLARGPEAFALSPDGRVAILDSVNKRLLLTDPGGVVRASAPLDLGDPRFLAASDEAVYVLEEGESRLLGFDWSGTLNADLALPRFDEPVTGLFLRKNRLFVEVLHDEVCQVRLKGKGAAGTVKVNGRPANIAGDRQAQARLLGQRSALVRTVDPSGTAREQELAFSRSIEHLVSLDADSQGRLALGARLLQSEGTPPTAPELMVSRVPDPGKPPSQSVLLDESGSLAFLGEPYRYGPDGRVYQPVATEQAFTILVHELPEADR